jgi:hypothetical protein
MPSNPLKEKHCLHIAVSAQFVSSDIFLLFFRPIFYKPFNVLSPLSPPPIQKLLLNTLSFVCLFLYSYTYAFNPLPSPYFRLQGQIVLYALTILPGFDPTHWQVRLNSFHTYIPHLLIIRKTILSETSLPCSPFSLRPTNLSIPSHNQT